MIPRVKFENIKEKSFCLKGEIGFLCESEYLRKATSALSLFLPGFKFNMNAENPIITAEREDSFAEEEYFIKAKDGKVRIKYATYKGLCHALAAFSLLVKERDGELLVSESEISDFPAASHRGVMLDVARGVMPLERLKEDIVLIAKARMNFLHLHLADSKGVAIELDSLPKECRLPCYYTRAEVEEINELCDILGLEIIPEFDMPAHSTVLNELFPELRCKTDIPDQSLWTACPGSEETYSIFGRVIEEISAMFRGGRYFHIGGDELEFLDLVKKEKKPRICHWEVCEKCKRRMKEENLRDRIELNYYFINRMNEKVSSLGRRTVIWSDQIDTTRKAGVSRDVLFQFWRVAGKGRGPHDGCSMMGQLDLGYDLINSHYPNTYVDLEEYMNAENLSDWRWDESPTCREEHRSRIFGSEVCAWEYGNLSEYPHYAYSLPSAVFLMADKLWGGEKRKFTREDEIFLTRAALGASIPDGFNVFSAIGDIFPPRSEKLSYPDKVTLSEKELKEIVSLLKKTTPYQSVGDRFRSDSYVKCIESVISEKYGG